MVGRITHLEKSLFNFGPLALEYDRWYETPAGEAHDRVQKEDVRRLLHPASGQTLLDVGCGTGHWSSFFAEMGYQVTGIDVAPEMIDVARRAVPECTFQIADACELPFEDASFDVVASMVVLEFLPNPTTAVQEMARCAKLRGSLLFGTLNRLAPLNKHRISKGKEPYASGHLFSPAELRSLLSPWGRVSMVASSPRRDERRPLLPKRILGRIAAHRRKLDGPFIVAEVRL